jgi:periplasmic divalent cation tolerance protein
MDTPEDEAPQVRVVLCTCPPDAADGIAGALIEARLAACVNALPGIVSTYRWEGAVTRDEESLLLIKTTQDRLGALADRIREIHPYEVPEVIAVPVTGGLAPYIEWVGAESRAPG